MHELRITLRTLGRARGYVAAVVLTLGFAIALETSMLAVVNAYVVRDLPYPAADRLYSISYVPRGEYPPDELNAVDWSALSDVIEHSIAWDLDVFYMLGGDYPQRASGAWVTPGFARGLGLSPALGRSLTPADFEPGRSQVALISHRLWQNRFAGDSGVLGQSFRAYVSDRPSDPESFTIVGVLRPDFWHINPYTDVITPLRGPSYPYFVRLRRDVPPDVAEQRIASLVRSVVPPTPSFRVTLQSVHSRYTESIRPLLIAVGGAAGIVLLIACANVALLTILRGSRRHREIAVRLALGARLSQIARLLLGESLVLTTAAAILGVSAAAFVLRFIAPVIERQLGRQVPGGAGALSIDRNVLLVIVMSTMTIAALVSLAPLLVSTWTRVASTLRARRAGDSVGGRRMRASLITLEVAGSLALLVGCGLMLRTVVRMLNVDVGIRVEGVVSTTLAIREQSYNSAASRTALYERLMATIDADHWSNGIALSNPSPLVTYQPRRIDSDAGSSLRMPVRDISAEYFDLLGIPLRAGRVFTAADRGSSDPVAVLSETAARRLWQNSDPIGRSIRLMQLLPSGDSVLVTRTVVGVVRDARQAVTDEELADVYVPLLQTPGRFTSVVMRRGHAGWAPLAELRRVMRAIDPEVSVGDLEPLDVTIARQLERPRLLTALFAAFGVFATVLGVMGLFAVIAFAVRQREREIALRMALGAARGDVLRLFLREGSLVLATGVGFGVAGAIVMGRVLETQLFGIRAVDLATIVSVALLLTVAALVAIWIPARQATRTEPMVALKLD